MNQAACVSQLMVTNVRGTGEAISVTYLTLNSNIHPHDLACSLPPDFMKYDFRSLVNKSTVTSRVAQI